MAGSFCESWMSPLKHFGSDFCWLLLGLHFGVNYVTLSPKSDLICFVGNVNSDLRPALIRYRNCCFLTCPLGGAGWGYCGWLLSLARAELFFLCCPGVVRWLDDFTLFCLNWF